MNPEQKYIIKYLDPFDSKIKNQYWFKDKEDWVGDPNRATQFNNPEGITEVGRLLVEHEWVTRLIPAEEIQMVKPVSPPSGEFILIVDCDGDPQEVFSGNVSLDQVFQLIDKLDRESGYHPHSAWRWNSETQSNWGGFSQVLERVGKDPK